jgi:hypothetical protein
MKELQTDFTLRLSLDCIFPGVLWFVHKRQQGNNWFRAFKPWFPPFQGYFTHTRPYKETIRKQRRTTILSKLFRPPRPTPPPPVAIFSSASGRALQDDWRLGLCLIGLIGRALLDAWRKMHDAIFRVLRDRICASGPCCWLSSKVWPLWEMPVVKPTK